LRAAVLGTIVALRVFSPLVCAAAVVPATSAQAAPWTVSIDERNGLPTLAIGGASAVLSKFAFWGKDWAWADTTPAFRIAGALNYAMTAQNAMLGFDLRSTIRKQSERQLKYELEIEVHRPQTNVIGGGISFAFDLPKGVRELGDPEILAGNAGWAWGRREST